MLRKLVVVLVLVGIFMMAIASADDWNYDTDFDLEKGFEDGIVIARNINLREKPGKSSRTITSLKTNDTMTILDKSDKWFLVELADGTQGWVRKMFVSQDFGYIDFYEPTNIYCVPSVDSIVLVNPESVVGRRIQYIGVYGNFLKVKLGYGIGFVEINNRLIVSYFLNEYIKIWSF